jgi:hypothetical protein
MPMHDDEQLPDGDGRNDSKPKGCWLRYLPYCLTDIRQPRHTAQRIQSPGGIEE